MPISGLIVREVARNGFASGQVLLQGLFLDGPPLATLFSFRADAGNFAFKIAYDETFAKYSPGVQVTLTRCWFPPEEWQAISKQGAGRLT